MMNNDETSASVARREDDEVQVRDEDEVEVVQEQVTVTRSETLNV